MHIDINVSLTPYSLVFWFVIHFHGKILCQCWFTVANMFLYAIFILTYRFVFTLNVTERKIFVSVSAFDLILNEGNETTGPGLINCVIRCMLASLNTKYVLDLSRRLRTSAGYWDVSHGVCDMRIVWEHTFCSLSYVSYTFYRMLLMFLDETKTGHRRWEGNLIYYCRWEPGILSGNYICGVLNGLC